MGGWDSDDSDDEEKTESREFMAAFFREVDEVKDGIHAVQRATRKIERITNQRTMSVDEDEDAKLSRALGPLVERTNARIKATRDALSQAQVVENKMMARVLRGSSQDVQLLVRHPGLWERWLGKLRKRGFFDGVDEGSPEFDERVRKALRAFARSPGVREFDSG